MGCEISVTLTHSYSMFLLLIYISLANWLVYFVLEWSLRLLKLLVNNGMKLIALDTRTYVSEQAGHIKELTKGTH